MRASLSRPRVRWLAPVALVLITGLAAFLRYWQLDAVPPGFHYDEAYEALEAWRVLTQADYRPVFFAGNFGVEPMFIYLTALAFRLFGAAPEVMRGVGAAVGTLTVPALYLLAREWVRADSRLPQALPLLAVLALAIQRWHITFSRMGIEPILVPLFLVLLLWMYARARRTGSLWAWVGFGLTAGLGPYTYPAGRLLPVLAALLGVVALVEMGWAGRGEKDTRRPAADPAHPERSSAVARAAESKERPLTGAPASFDSVPPDGWRDSAQDASALHIPAHDASTLGDSAQDASALDNSAQGASVRRLLMHLLLAGAVALIVVAPLALNFAQHPDQLLLRSSQIAVAPGVAGSDTLLTGGPLRNFIAALGMFNLRGDADSRSNVSGMPVLDVLMGIPFVIGVLLFAWRWRRAVSLTWWLAFAVMLVPTVFSDYAPHFRRAVGLAPLVALAAGYGLAVILGRQGDQPVTAARDVPWRLRQSGVPADEIAADMDRLRRIGRAGVVATILLGSLVISATAYFGTWGRSAVLYYAYDQGLWEIGQYVLSLPADERVYVSPRPASDTTLGFAWRAGRTVRHFDGRHAFVTPEDGTGAATYIIIEYEDFRSWRVLDELYPARREVRQFLDRAGNVYARAYRLDGGQRPARGPGQAVDATWSGFSLIGYDTDRAVYAPGQIVYLQLWWRADAPVSTDWTVFTHLLGPVRPDGSTLWAGQDARPGQGSAPTTTWEPGDLVLDEYQLRVPEDAPPGEYSIEIGVYDPTRGGQRGVTTTGADHVIVGTLRVE